MGWVVVEIGQNGRGDGRMVQNVDIYVDVIYGRSLTLVFIYSSMQNPPSMVYINESFITKRKASRSPIEW